jgi:hypothetical protein
MQTKKANFSRKINKKNQIFENNENLCACFSDY